MKHIQRLELDWNSSRRKAAVSHWGPLPVGDVKFLSDDLAALKPTIFVGVPRVFDRIYSGVQGQVKKTGELLVLMRHMDDLDWVRQPCDHCNNKVDCRVG